MTSKFNRSQRFFNCGLPILYLTYRFTKGFFKQFLFSLIVNDKMQWMIFCLKKTFLRNLKKKQTSLNGFKTHGEAVCFYTLQTSSTSF